MQLMIDRSKYVNGFMITVFYGYDSSKTVV